MNGNLMEGPETTAKSILIKLAEESFEVEKEYVYNKLKTLTFKNEIDKIPTDFLSFLDFFKGNPQDFLMALSNYFIYGENSQKINVFKTESNENDNKNINLEFNENNFMSVIVTDNFYNQFDILFKKINLQAILKIENLYGEGGIYQTIKPIISKIRIIENNGIRTYEAYIENEQQGRRVQITNFEEDFKKQLSNKLGDYAKDFFEILCQHLVPDSRIKVNKESDSNNNNNNIPGEILSLEKFTGLKKVSNFDQNIFTDILTEAYNKVNKKNKKDNIGIELLSQDDIEDYFKSTTPVKEMQKFFYDCIDQALDRVSIQKETVTQDKITIQASFRKWWNNNRKNIFSFFSQTLSHNESFLRIIAQMLSKKSNTTDVLLKGNLGELLLGLFLQHFSIKGSKNLITGKAENIYGSIGIDNLMLFENAKKGLRALGVQVKNFPSIEDIGGGVFYSQSNQLFSKLDKKNNPIPNVSLKKYFPDDTLEKFCKGIWYYGKEANELNDLLTTLSKTLPYYLRTKDTLESDEKNSMMNFLKSKLGDEKELINNFYSFNFRIFPTSIILFLLSEAIGTEQGKTSVNNLFYLSEKQSEKKDDKWHSWSTISNNKTFSGSLEEFSGDSNGIKNLYADTRYFLRKGDGKKKDSNKKEGNLKQAIFLNFKGMYIKFKGAKIDNLVKFNI